MMVSATSAAGWCLAALFAGYALGSRVGYYEIRNIVGLMVRDTVAQVQSLRPPPMDDEGHRRARERHRIAHEGIDSMGIPPPPKDRR